MENCWCTLQPILINVSANQLSLYGAVAEVCEEYESLHERMERPVVMEQASSVSSRQKFFWIVMTRSTKIFYCSNMENELKKLWQQDKLSKFFMDAGFLSVVEIGQHLVTKDTTDLSHFHAVARREYTFKTWRSITTQRKDPREHPNWARVGRWNQLFAWLVWSWDQNLVLEQRQKFPKFSSKNLRYNSMRKIFHADQRPMQNHKEENLLALHQEEFVLGGRNCRLNQGNILSPIVKYRRK